eukprot:s2590_g9.t1
MRLVSSTWRENDFIGLLKDVQCSLELPEGVPATKPPASGLPHLSDDLRTLGILGILRPEELVDLLKKFVFTPVLVTASFASKESPSGDKSMERLTKACDEVCVRVCKGLSAVDSKVDFNTTYAGEASQSDNSSAAVKVARGYATWLIQAAAYAVGAAESPPTAPILWQEARSDLPSEVLAQVDKELLMTLCLHEDLFMSICAASDVSKLRRLYLQSLDCIHGSEDAAVGFLDVLCGQDTVPAWLGLHGLSDEGRWPTISRPWLQNNLQQGLRDLLEQLTPHLEAAMASSVEQAQKEEWTDLASGVFHALECRVRCRLPDERHADWQPSGESLERLATASLLCDAEEFVSSLRHFLVTPLHLRLSAVAPVTLQHDLAKKCDVLVSSASGNPSVFYGKVIATFADPSRTEDCDPAWMQEFEACLEKELHGHAFDPDDLRCKLFGDLFGESLRTAAQCVNFLTLPYAPSNCPSLMTIHDSLDAPSETELQERVRLVGILDICFRVFHWFDAGLQSSPLQALSDLMRVGAWCRQRSTTEHLLRDADNLLCQMGQMAKEFLVQTRQLALRACGEQLQRMVHPVISFLRNNLRRVTDEAAWRDSPGLWALACLRNTDEQLHDQLVCEELLIPVHLFMKSLWGEMNEPAFVKVSCNFDELLAEFLGDRSLHRFLYVAK